MSTHNPYTCAECNRLGWNHTDEEPWPTTEPVVLPKRRDATLILLAFLAIAVIGVIAWSAQR